MDTMGNQIMLPGCPFFLLKKKQVAKQQALLPREGAGLHVCQGLVLPPEQPEAQGWFDGVGIRTENLSNSNQ